MTHDEARNVVPPDAWLSCTFGYPGVGGYAEYWRDPDDVRYVVSNGPYDAMAPFDWRVTTLRDVD